MPRAAFWEGTERNLPRTLRNDLFGEEPEKQRPAVPQDAGKTPSACPSRRRPVSGVDRGFENRNGRKSDGQALRHDFLRWPLLTECIDCISQRQ